MKLWRRLQEKLSLFFPLSAEELERLKAEDDADAEQMAVAISEYKALIHDPAHYIDPLETAAFRSKWSSLFENVRAKRKSSRYKNGNVSPRFAKIAQSFLNAMSALTQYVSAHNEKIAVKKAEEVRALILPVEGRQLDRQQLCCIGKDVQSHLVLAGAGTGKTTTIVGYIKYLLLSGMCKPGDMLVLSFTNASAAEMAERIKAETGYSLDAHTFHKLGMNIITAVEGKKPKISKVDLRRFVTEKILELSSNPDYLQKLIYYVIFGEMTHKSEFDFSTQEEYQRFLKLNPPTTIDNIVVKSYGELDIANYLYCHGIKYLYEHPYPVDTRTEEFGQYYPDFYLPEYNIYIEYYGIDGKGKVPKYFRGKNGKSPKETYMDGIRWKRQIHRQNNTNLIELYSFERMEGAMLLDLEVQLRSYNVKLVKRPAEEIWADISKSRDQILTRMAELLATVINLTKSNNYTIKDVREKRITSFAGWDVELAIDLAEPIYNAYQEKLASEDEIDFNDMINRATEYVISGMYRHNYKYVIVDEYQDISKARYRLICEMRKQKEFKLFCVGDDWQGIYRFSGSDIGFILHFQKYWGPSEVSRIETTYRFPEKLIQISSGFIMKNPNQMQKDLHSNIQAIGFPAEVVTGYNEKYALSFLADRLRELPIGCSVLLLGRYRNDIQMLDRSSEFDYFYNNVKKEHTVSLVQREDIKMSFMTIHTAKGLQADYVVILNNKEGARGFPSKITDAPIIQILLEKGSDTYPLAEERRLFYVALTRAKKKVWLLAIKDRESEFLRELTSKYSIELEREQFTCPWCGGRLIRGKDQNGEFFGCSNFSETGCGFKRILTRPPKQVY